MLPMQLGRLAQQVESTFRSKTYLMDCIELNQYNKLVCLIFGEIFQMHWNSYQPKNGQFKTVRGLLFDVANWIDDSF